MNNSLILLKNIGLISEMFFCMSLIYLILFGSVLSTHKKYPILQKIILNLSILILFLYILLNLNNNLSVTGNLLFNFTIIDDYLSFFSKIFITSFCLICLLVIKNYIKDQKLNQFEYSIIIMISILGFFLLCSSNDFITAYLAIELQSLAFYIMAAFKKDSFFSVEAGLKYFILGSFSSALLLFGFSLIYGLTGTLNLTDLKDLFFFLYPNANVTVETSVNTELLQVALFFLLTSLLFKLSVAPLHVWSPDVYENSPTSSTIFFAVISKLSLLVFTARIFQFSFHGLIYNWRYLLLLLAVLSVIIGSFTAISQKKLKSLLTYSSVSHIGYLLISFSSGTFEGIQNLLAYIFIYMLAGLCIWSIFLVLRLKTFYIKKKNKDLTDMSLLIKMNSGLALCFSIVLFSIAGFPPLVGFFTKMNIFLTSIESFMYFAAIVAILASVVSTFYYIRVIKILYFEEVIVGNLYYSLNYIEPFIVTSTFFCFMFFFIDPTYLYLISYKIGLLFYFF
jgi:NADH-quinone oxidoreductase subunit N